MQYFKLFLRVGGGLGIARFFFFNDTATTEIYTLSLHDALPISAFFEAGRLHQIGQGGSVVTPLIEDRRRLANDFLPCLDRKSTRLNSSHQIISYAVFCLKKKKYPFHSLTDPGTATS